MKCKIYLCDLLSVVVAFLSLSVLVTGVRADPAFANAVGVWNFQSRVDSSPNGDDLQLPPSAALGIALAGKPRQESLLHHGDGYVAQTSGDPILAGKAGGALAVNSDGLTILMRVKDPAGVWGGELVKRREPVLSYNVYTYDFGHGSNNMTLGFEIGTVGQPFNTCKFLMNQLPNRRAWLDIVARYDGKKMQLIVNGKVMASAPASGALVSAPDDQFMIGNKFHGQFDTVAIWNRALTNSEVAKLSDISTVESSPYLNTSTNRGPFYTAYQEMIDAYQKNPVRYSELYRPQFHWTPVAGWMNDPNGLVYFDGLWRQFAQHNLDGENGKRWAYATSPDLVHWTQHPEAILPDDLGDIWSGSAVVDEHDTSGFFHGKSGIVCIYTYFKANDGGRQSQGIAYSSDGVTFTKYPGNPVIPELRTVHGQEDDADFRDPKVFWYEPTKRWIMVTGGGYIRIWSSPNLREWTNECVEKDIVSECPDLFPLYLDGNRNNGPVWVLSKAGVEYLLGSFDGHRFTPHGPAQRFNYGPEYYAAQTWSHVPDGRRIMTAWMWSFADQDPAGISTTGGMLTLPVELTLATTPDGPKILQRPVAELKQLRRNPFVSTDVFLTARPSFLENAYGNQCEIVANIEMGTASKAGLSIMGDSAGAETIVGYDAVKREVYIDRSHSGLTGVTGAGDYFSAPLALDQNHVTLHIFVDHSSVEVFAGNGLVAMTARCFPPATAKTTKAFAVGGEATLKSIQIYPMASSWRK